MVLRSLDLPAGRRLVLDDVGAPDGRPVLYLHGTPDARQARHPDDGLAATAGVRLLALDRPGFGASDRLEAATSTAMAAALVAALDALGLERVAVLGWSSGGLAALQLAALAPDRVDELELVTPIPPVEAYADPTVRAALGPSRQPFAELALELPPAELAAELVPYLLPEALDAATAVEHVLEGAGPVGRAELDAVPGAAEALAAALAATVAAGPGGVEDDLLLQLEPGLPLGAVTAPVRLLHGGRDGVAPPEVGAWLAERLARAEVAVVPDAGHHLLFPRWADLMRSLGREAAG